MQMAMARAALESMPVDALQLDCMARTPGWASKVIATELRDNACTEYYITMACEGMTEQQRTRIKMLPNRTAIAAVQGAGHRCPAFRHQQQDNHMLCLSKATTRRYQLVIRTTRSFLPTLHDLDT